jgi:hypothetical protein
VEARRGSEASRGGSEALVHEAPPRPEDGEPRSRATRATVLGLSGCQTDRSFVLCVAEGADGDDVIDFALEADDPGDGRPLEPVDVVPTRVGDGRVVVYGLTFPARRVRILASRRGSPPVRWDYDPTDGGSRPQVVRHWLLEPKPAPTGPGAC